LVGCGIVLAALLVVPATSQAQFGHPLKGQWSGEWVARAATNRILLDLDWTGQDIVGSINPGPDAARVTSVTFDYTNPASWGVKIQAEGKDASGKAVAIAIDGKLENIGAYVKHFHGTWTQGAVKGPFTLTRN
jgi:hypothetical protein